MAKLLTKEDIFHILSKRFENDKCKKLSMLPSPFLFKDIKKAAIRIKEAIKKGEKIAIVGDYDVDGVVSSAIISEFFDDLGINYKIKIPDRFKNGYGISPQIVEELDANLIITVDNGITAIDAAEVCQKRGIDLIITDHHTPINNLPKAFAIINPKQNGCNFPSTEICGAQVAWYLCAALKKELSINYDLSKFLDILAIAIIADMMELKDINRTMVRSGLQYLNKSKRFSIQAIKTAFDKEEFTSEDISFLLAPLLNSAGRMDHAKISYNFLKSKSLREAFLTLEHLIELNNRRKETERELLQRAEEFVQKDKPIIVAWGENWHEGVIGIVAAKLVRKYEVPVILFSINKDVAKGSARSVGDIDIIEIIKKEKDILLGYGGHKGAAGISLKKENLEIFKQRMEERFSKIPKEMFLQKEEILGEIDPKAIDFQLLKILNYFEPYGQENPIPLFIIKDAYVKIDKLIGKNKNHQKLILQKEFATLESLDFNFEERAVKGDKINIIFSVSKNVFRGIITPQLLIRKITKNKN